MDRENARGCAKERKRWEKKNAIEGKRRVTKENRNERRNYTKQTTKK